MFRFVDVAVVLFCFVPVMNLRSLANDADRLLPPALEKKAR